MKLFAIVVAVLAVGATASPLLGNLLGGGGHGVLGGLTNTVSGTVDSVPEIDASLSDILNGLVRTIDETIAIQNGIVGSAAPALNKLTGVLSEAFSVIVSIVYSPPLGLGGGKDDNAGAISRVECILIELVQSINFAKSANLVNLDGVAAIIEGIVVSSIGIVADLSATVIEIVASTTAAEVIAAFQLILKSVIEIVSKVFVSAQNLTAEFIDVPSAVLSAAISTMDQASSSINEIHSELSSKSPAAISGIVSSLEEIVTSLYSTVSSLVPAATENVSKTFGSFARDASGASVDSLSSLNIESDLSPIVSEISTALERVRTHINDAFDVVANAFAGIIGVVEIAVSGVFDSIVAVIATVALIKESTVKTAGSVNGFANVLNVAMNELITAVQDVVKSIISIANNVIDAQLAAVLQNIVAVVITISQPIIEAVGCLLYGRFVSITKIPASLSEIQSECLTNILSSIKEITGNIYESMNKLSDSVSAHAGNVIDSLPGPLCGVVGSPAGIVGSLTGTLAGVTGALSGISGSINEITGNISSPVNKLPETADGMAENLTGVIGPVSAVEAEAAATLSLHIANVAVVLQTFEGILLGLGF